jgi:dUTP pyrophosphatase
MTLTNETKEEMTPFPKIKVHLDDGAFIPERHHTTDAGADIRTPVAIDVPAHGSAQVRTGVHVELPPMTAGIFVSKSGLNFRHDITSTGLIDEGYDGEIGVKLYNHGNTPYHFERGDKISQMVVVSVLYPTYEQADEIAGGERGSHGFGSTGR